MMKKFIVYILLMIGLVLIILLGVIYGGVRACDNSGTYLATGFKCVSLPEPVINKPYDLGNYSLLNLENG